MELIINTLINNYLIVSMDDDRLLFEITNNERACLDLRKKMNNDLLAISQRQLSKVFDETKRAELRIFLLNKIAIYTRLIDHYTKLADRWKKQGHTLASKVALVLVENEKLNLESFCELIVD